MEPVIGIIGAGHLGRALALLFQRTGIPEDDILISHAGTPTTLDAIRQAGLEGNLAGNPEICRRASILFIAVRPQSAGSLSGLPFPRDGQVISCMAGIPSDLISRRWGVPVTRMMPSGPDTLLAGKGVAAVFPDNPRIVQLLELAGIRVVPLQDEEEMHVFTAGVCLPAAILAAPSGDPEPGIEETCRAFPLIAELRPWAFSVLPRLPSSREREAWIAAMSTKGGITETIVQAIRAGRPFPEAFRAGVARCRAISAEAGRSV